MSNQIEKTEFELPEITFELAFSWAFYKKHKEAQKNNTNEIEELSSSE